jgi:hypothetical protein
MNTATIFSSAEVMTVPSSFTFFQPAGISYDIPAVSKVTNSPFPPAAAGEPDAAGVADAAGVPVAAGLADAEGAALAEALGAAEGALLGVPLAGAVGACEQPAKITKDAITAINERFMLCPFETKVSDC